jgi:YihY family inner membrane protein
MPLPYALQHPWKIAVDAAERFARMDGTQWAAAFAHFAFFGLFPLVVLAVSIASAFIDRDLAGMAIIAYIESYVPIDSGDQRYIFDTVNGVVQSRGQAGLLALVVLVWAALGFLSTLIRATNRAWMLDGHHWLRLPLQSLLLLIILVGGVLISIALPIAARALRDWLLPTHDFSNWVYEFGNSFVPLLVVFVGLSLLYRLAPRRRTRFREVWVGALCATLLLQAARALFVIYLKHFVSLNALYGTFGGIIALLLWIYLSGCIFIFGACLCAAQADKRRA